MKIFTKTLLLIILIFSSTPTYASWFFKDKLNLLNDNSIKHAYYHKNGNSIFYSELNQKPRFFKKQSIVLLIHSGVERSNIRKYEHITYPGFQSIVKYIRKNNINTVILLPQYIIDPYPDIYEYLKSDNELAFNLLMDKAKEYKIPKNKIYIVGTCVGAIAVSDILDTHPNVFSKAGFVASKALDFNTDKIFNTKLYFVQGDKDSIDAKINMIGNLKNKSIYATLNILKNTDHVESLKMNVGYPDELWDWLFK